MFTEIYESCHTFKSARKIHAISKIIKRFCSQKIINIRAIKRLLKKISPIKIEEKENPIRTNKNLHSESTLTQK